MKTRKHTSRHPHKAARAEKSKAKPTQEQAKSTALVPTDKPSAGNKFEELKRPVTLEKVDDIMLFSCPGCGNIHFRHAGYVETQLPYMRSDREARIGTESMPVRVCTKCRRSFFWMNTKCYEVTKLIDLQAWQRAEEELHQATGGGGKC